MIAARAACSFGDAAGVEFELETDAGYGPDQADDLRRRVSAGLADALTALAPHLIAEPAADVAPDQEK